MLAADAEAEGTAIGSWPLGLANDCERLAWVDKGTWLWTAGMDGSQGGLVGVAEGAGDGLVAGVAEGAGDGLVAGVAEGAGDGVAVGADDGEAVGAAVGVAVGADDGEAVGVAVGADDGEADDEGVADEADGVGLGAGDAPAGTITETVKAVTTGPG